MHIAIVRAGLAGLATAAAFSRTGHEVTVFEQAAGLRAERGGRLARRRAR